MKEKDTATLATFLVQLYFTTCAQCGFSWSHQWYVNNDVMSSLALVWFRMTCLNITKIKPQRYALYPVILRRGPCNILVTVTLIIITSIIKNCLMKSEVGMAVL